MVVNHKKSLSHATLQQLLNLICELALVAGSSFSVVVFCKVSMRRESFQLGLMVYSRLVQP